MHLSFTKLNKLFSANKENIINTEIAGFPLFNGATFNMVVQRPVKLKFKANFQACCS